MTWRCCQIVVESVEGVLFDEVDGVFYLQPLFSLSVCSRSPSLLRLCSSLAMRDSYSLLMMGWALVARNWGSAVLIVTECVLMVLYVFLVELLERSRGALLRM